jgi:hypothetical protein
MSILDEAKKPNMRLKLIEYIKELDEEIDRLEDIIKPSNGISENDEATFLSRIITLTEVKSDLNNRMEEII